MASCLASSMNMRADRIAHAARAGVQHEPHAAGLVQAHLDEVVAGAERAEVHAVVGLGELRVVAHSSVNSGSSCAQALSTAPGTLPHAPGSRAARRAAMRHGALDGRAQRAQVVGQVFGAQAGLAGHHAAADVHAHGGRDDGLAGRDHRAHGGADAQCTSGMAAICLNTMGRRAALASCRQPRLRPAPRGSTS